MLLLYQYSGFNIYFAGSHIIIVDIRKGISPKGIFLPMPMSKDKGFWARIKKRISYEKIEFFEQPNNKILFEQRFCFQGVLRPFDVEFDIL